MIESTEDGESPSGITISGYIFFNGEYIYLEN